MRLATNILVMTIEQIAEEFNCDVGTAEKAYGIWEANSYTTDAFDVGKKRKDFFRRTINRILNSESEEIPARMRKMFPRNGD